MDMTNLHSYCYLYKIKDPYIRIDRWINKYQDYYYTIMHKYGKIYIGIDCYHTFLSL